MADRYLLESGAPDGYLLEDGSGVLLLEGPLPGGGDGDEWWAGVQNCFVGVAIAGALAAASTAALAQRVATQDQAEQMAPPAIGGGVLKDRARVWNWPTGDDLPVFVAPSFVPEDDSWRTPALLPQPAIGQPASFSDDIVPQPMLAHEEDGPRLFSLAEAPRRLTLDLPDEVPTPAVTPALDDSVWTWQQAWPSQPWATVQQTQDEIETAAPTFAVEVEAGELVWVRADVSGIIWVEQDEVSQQPAGATGGGVLKDRARVLRWAQTDEFLPQAASVVAEDDFRPLAPLPPPAPWLALPWHQDEVQAAFVVEDDAWPLPAQTWPQPLAWAPAQIDELPNVPDEGESWAAAPLAPQVLAPLWTDADDFVPPAPALDDGTWLQLWAAPVTPSLRVWSDQEDIVPQPPANITAEDTPDFFFVGPVLVPPTVTVWGPTANEDVPPLSGPTSVNVSLSVTDADDTLSSTFRVQSWRVKKKAKAGPRGWVQQALQVGLSIKDADDTVRAVVSKEWPALDTFALLVDADDTLSAGVSFAWPRLQVVRSTPRIRPVRSSDWST